MAVRFVGTNPILQSRFKVLGAIQRDQQLILVRFPAGLLGVGRDRSIRVIEQPIDLLLLGALSPPVDSGSLDDSASIAMLLAERYGDDIEGYLRSTDRGRQLIGLGYGKDIEYCSRRDSIRRIPELIQGLIEP